MCVIVGVVPRFLWTLPKHETMLEHQVERLNQAHWPVHLCPNPAHRSLPQMVWNLMSAADYDLTTQMITPLMPRLPPQRHSHSDCDGLLHASYRLQK